MNNRSRLTPTILVRASNMRTRTQLQSALLSTTLLATTGASHGAEVTNTAAPGEQVAEVVVTGSRIRGVGPIGSDAFTFDEVAIEKAGFSSPAELLRSMPQIANLGADESRIGTGGAQGAGANVTAATGINLRGLGTEATLTLLNGRRLPPGGQQAQLIDPNTIPSIALARMEVVADGASAIYGADAVGGVVNMVLKKNVNGAQTQMRYGFADGVKQRQFMQLFGKTWSTGNLLFAYENNYRSSLEAEDRPDQYTDDFTRFGGPNLQPAFNNPGTIVAGGVNYAIPPGQNGVGLQRSSLIAGTVNRRSIHTQSDALPEQQRHTMLATIEQDIGERVTLSFEGFGTKRHYNRKQGGTSTSLTVPASNPFFVSPIPGATSVTVQYDLLDDLGPVTQYGISEAYQGALIGKVDLGADWQLDLHASWGRNIEERRFANQAYTPYLTAALASTNPATAFNPFGDGSVTNPQTVNGIRSRNPLNYTRYELIDYVAKADGPLFSIGGGEVRAAIGAERMEDDFYGYNLSERGLASLTRTVSFNPTRTRNAVFAEVFVPLIGAPNAMRGAQRLDVSIAGRYEDASDFGSTSDPKIGVRWDPLQSLSFRGSYGTSYRAPTLSDVEPYSTAAIFIQNFVDPTSTTGLRRGMLVLGGKPEVKPETATTWSLGVDWRPQDIAGLLTSLTYYNVHYKNRIDQPGQEANPLLREQYLGPAGLIIRNPTAAQVTALYASPVFSGVAEAPTNIGVIVDARKTNVGEVKTSGIDANINYAWNTAVGSWNVGGFAGYVLEFKRAFAPTAPLIDFVNLVNYPSELRLRASAGWEGAAWSINGFVNYTNSYDNDLVTPVQGVDAYTTVDAQVSYRFVSGEAYGPFDDIRLSLNAQNLFDEAAPFARVGTVAFDSQNASPMGRFISVQLSVGW